MNLQQLKAFVVLSECLSVTETAERLFCTQPSVSIKIKNLEQSLDTILFERINNRLFLTEQGKIFRQYALKILQLLETAQEHIHQYDDPSYGKITFGASHFVGAYLLPKVIARYKQIAPNVEIRMDILPSQQLIQRLENHELEFVIMSDQVCFENKEKEYISESFFDDEMVLIASSTHPFSQYDNVDFNAILEETLIIKPSQSETSKFLLKHLDESAIKKLKILEINNLEGIKHCILNQLGIAIISKLAVEQELKRGELKEIKLSSHQFIRGINYIHHKSRILSPATHNFLQTLFQLKY